MTFRFLKELKGLYSDPSLCPVQRFPYFCFLYRILIFCVLCFWSKQRIVFFTAIHPWFASMLLTWSWLVIVTANLRRYGSVEKYIHTPSRFVLRKLEWVQDEWATWLEHRLNLVIFFSLPFWIFFKHFGVADLNSWTNICCFFKIYFCFLCLFRESIPWDVIGRLFTYTMKSHGTLQRLEITTFSQDELPMHNVFYEELFIF